MRRRFSTVAGTGCGKGVCGKLRHVHCHKCGVEAKNHVIYFRGTTPRTLQFMFVFKHHTQRTAFKSDPIKLCFGSPQKRGVYLSCFTNLLIC